VRASAVRVYILYLYYVSSSSMACKFIAISFYIGVKWVESSTAVLSSPRRRRRRRRRSIIIIIILLLWISRHSSLKSSTRVGPKCRSTGTVSHLCTAETTTTLTQCYCYTLLYISPCANNNNIIISPNHWYPEDASP